MSVCITPALTTTSTVPLHVMASNVFDRRRVNGPEESHRITFNSEQITELTNWKPDQPRPGRLPDDIRPICAQVQFILSYTCVDNCSSHTPRSYQSSKRFSLHRNCKDQDCLRCVSLDFIQILTVYKQYTPSGMDLDSLKIWSITKLAD